MSEVVAIDRVSKRFGNHQALDNVSVTIAEGELLALLGHNGAGKTTLIKMMLGLLRPDQGHVRVLGGDPSDSRQRGQLSVGYLPEQVSLYDNLSGREVLQYFAKLRGIAAHKVERLLTEQGLQYAADKRVATYSKGMKQRLGLAQALLSEPKLLLLDEPTVGLDPSASMAFYQQIADIRARGTAVVICTHELTLIEPHLDRALIVAGGRIKGLGDLPSLQQQSGLQSQLQLPPAVAALAQDDPYIGAYDATNHSIGYEPVQQGALLQHVIGRLGCNDFQLKPVGLSQIYHHCQRA
ncbi:ABC transporter ATP-binding protein [Ferrimonas senticii]|uniref:ABC transporter ATP-binding protein n=1 Tax=Ferrimonas senticii TaxID=394566 RepID=UPI000418AEB2|nr:ABC transporter ATP-binding protein [Ferrimonas senticii]